MHKATRHLDSQIYFWIFSNLARRTETSLEIKLYIFFCLRKKNRQESGWLSQLNVQLLISAQVMILWSSVRSSPLQALCFSTGPAWDSLSPSLSLTLPSIKINKLKRTKSHILTTFSKAYEKRENKWFMPYSYCSNFCHLYVNLW